MIETFKAVPKSLPLVQFNIPFVFLLILFFQSAFGQGGNSISGHVFGIDRRPLADLPVELLDDLNRTINRARTNGSGRYFFYGVPGGRFRIRVTPLGTGYEEQEQDIEIVNFSRTIASGETRTLGHSNEQRDFYLIPRRGSTGLGAPSSVFAQDVPDEAKALYKTALSDLENKRTKEAYTSLKASIEIFPKYFSALETLGIEYVKAGHFEAAEVLLSMAVKINPRAYKSWYGLARSLDSQKKSAEALVAIEKALEIDSLAPESLFLAGSLLRQAKKYADAEKRLNKAKELFRGAAPNVHWELALLYANGMKRYKEAAKELKLYLKAVPDDKNAENIKKLIVEFEAKAKES